MTYKVQIDDEIRDATLEEIAAINARRAHYEEQMDAAHAKNTVLASARIKLAALGLSEAEVAAIIGG